MIERHYSHLTPRLKKEMFAGIRRPKALTGVVDRVVEAREQEPV